VPLASRPCLTGSNSKLLFSQRLDLFYFSFPIVGLDKLAFFGKDHTPIMPAYIGIMTPDSFFETLDFACASCPQNQGFQKNCPECWESSHRNYYGVRRSPKYTIIRVWFCSLSTWMLPPNCSINVLTRASPSPVPPCRQGSFLGMR